ncbi:MAG: helix-turn-helix domain-containing protein [Verrucomicrobiales bacterium]|nr:helix-turn-helix domain-containing protein [Verrucomicrobiales bacterium]
MAKDESVTRRSPCPVSCTLDILGDRWTLLVIRDLMLGRSRYKEFCASPEGIPTNILAERLERLLQYEIIEKAPVSPESKRMAYHLTPKGKALKPLLVEITKWGLQWEEGTEARMQKKNTDT